MDNDNDMKRLFFGFEVIASWPQFLPEGRLLDPDCRHLTVAFLGQANHTKLVEILPDLPPIPFQVGLVGHFDKCLFLPKGHPNVAAWHVDWWDNPQPLEEYHHDLVEALRGHGFTVEAKDKFLPHVTLCRHPAHPSDWRDAFVPMAMMTKNLHLYESLGYSKYRSLWSHPIRLPFEEIEHTADIAFRILGQDLQQIFNHALAALAFKFPPLLQYRSQGKEEFHNLDDIIIRLNSIIGQADAEESCPFKAISLHGDISLDGGILMWEMIVDV